MIFDFEGRQLMVRISSVRTKVRAKRDAQGMPEFTADMVVRGSLLDSRRLPRATGGTRPHHPRPDRPGGMAASSRPCWLSSGASTPMRSGCTRLCAPLCRTCPARSSRKCIRRSRWSSR